MTTARLATFVVLGLATALTACSNTPPSMRDRDTRSNGGEAAARAGADKPRADIGMKNGRTAWVVLDGLTNPSGVHVSPWNDLVVCDGGNGRVLVVRDGAAYEYLHGFRTEFWKTNADTGAQSFKLGPLSALWLADGRLVVSDGGQPDGQEALGFYSASGTAESGQMTNSVGPTSSEAADKGEGNLTGLSVSPAGWIYVCGQGHDGGSWVLRCRADGTQLEPWASADAEGIGTNSPMQTLPTGDGTVLVLYSGAGGVEDGLIVEWSEATAKPVRQWTLPGLVDPMGMDWVPGGGGTLAVVDNNWALTEVKNGSLAVVRLGDTSGPADVSIRADGLRGPVSCAYGRDGTLYIAELGQAIDQDFGRVLAIRGVE